MFLEKLNIVQFKNIESVSLDFTNKINCFVGNNGAGKTNVLDSIYYLSMCKSAFVSSDKQSIMHGKDFFMLNGQYRVKESSFENVNCNFKNNAQKKIKRNDKEYQKLSEHIGLIPLVIIAPNDSSIINESSEERRRYLNQLLAQIDKQYLVSLMRYNQLLAQRNSLLKNIKADGQKEILDVIDIQISPLGKSIYNKRKEIITRIAPIVEQYYKILSGDNEKATLSYQSKLEGVEMEELLQDSFEKDCANQYTTCGIHRDEIKMSIMGYPIRKFGSQGQQKSFIIALKLAQFDIISQYTNKKPLLLLDDIFDRLDTTRVEGLISIVNSDKFGQIFITDCNKLRLDNILNKITDKYTIFTVKDSEITTCNEESQYL